ncbi:MAG: twin-arginine translocase TatA/TatE family subunit [Robiginitomaculum sp.]|nr:twin-arginine translocase TatA/TatE family subunit [Robiginitomaculum sp.]MDQ7077596.1 twin-arginine translocase TatA/TatE family subunit [Robiginitomaculum sp.]
MGSVGPLQIIVVAVVALILFGGRGKISSVMGDLAKGIKSFRKGLKDDDPVIEDKGETIDGTARREKSTSTED